MGRGQAQGKTAPQETVGSPQQPGLPAAGEMSALVSKDPGHTPQLPLYPGTGKWRLCMSCPPTPHRILLRETLWKRGCGPWSCVLTICPLLGQPRSPQGAALPSPELVRGRGSIWAPAAPPATLSPCAQAPFRDTLRTRQYGGCRNVAGLNGQTKGWGVAQWQSMSLSPRRGKKKKQVNLKRSSKWRLDSIL